MLSQPLQDLEAWVSFFSNAELPVLRQTARRLDEARQNIDKISGRDVAAIVLQDPLMAVRVLAYIQPVHGKHLHSEITTIAKAVMMLGIEPFFNRLQTPVTIEAALKDDAQALEIANDTLYGLGAGVWTRDGSRAFRMGRAIKAGRVWTNCYHHYPAHAAFGGYKSSGVGRENHRMMLDHYSQTKCLLVSYDQNPMGFF